MYSQHATCHVKERIMLKKLETFYSLVPFHLSSETFLFLIIDVRAYAARYGLYELSTVHRETPRKLNFFLKSNQLH